MSVAGREKAPLMSAYQINLRTNWGENQPFYVDMSIGNCVGYNGEYNMGYHIWSLVYIINDMGYNIGHD
jgi:hypothetical protein